MSSTSQQSGAGQPGTVEEFDRLARFYDLTYGPIQDDLSLYLPLARRCGSPVLEVGCGTGRVLLPLAKAGFQVTGVDVSPAMLQVAHQKIEEIGLADKVHLALADARDLHLDQRFALAIVALDSFGLFVSRSDQVLVLEGIRRHLRPGGLLVMDLSSSDPVSLMDDDGVLVHHFTRREPTTGNTVMMFYSRRVHPADQTMETTYIYDEIDPGGRLRRTVLPFTLRYFFRSELELLLERCGFQVENVYGSYELEAYQDDSPRLICVASAATGGRCA